MMKEVHGGNIYKYDHKVYDFSANLNPLGMPEEVQRAIVDNVDNYENYPDPFNRELLKEISRFHHIKEDNICCGNGAADIIFRIAIGLKPKKALIISPTFSEYEQALNLVDCKVTHYLLSEKDGFILNSQVMNCITEDLDIVFICNPNNPTGIPVKNTMIMDIGKKCKEAQATLVVDECFTEFLEDEEQYSIMTQLENLDKVIILKAFTKIFAMAGLRLGYCLCSDSSQAEIINDTLQPWAVSTVASKAGVAALKIEGFHEKTKKYVKDNRKLLMEGLTKLGYRVYDSMANYVFFRSEKDLIKPLQEHNIMIRSCANYITLDQHYYRIAVRTKEENTYFLDCLTAVTKKYEDEKNG